MSAYSASSAREAVATAEFVNELLCEGLVERDHEVVTRELNGRTFMVEVRLLDVTEAGS